MNQFTRAAQPLAEAAGRINNLMDQTMRLGLDLMESLNQVRASMMSGMAQPGGIARMMGGLRAGSRCGCDIPPPCWMPVSLGELTSFICPGGVATLRLRVTNCSDRPRQVSVDAKQPNLPVTVTPAVLTLGPQERGVFTLTAPVPTSATAGQESEALIWVRGCKEHYLRWTVQAATRGGDCCHEMDVDDCPDLIHHWYDHFYCQRSCPERSPDVGRG